MAAADAAEYITPYTGGIRPYVRGTATISMPDVQAGIVSHHGLASTMIARFYDVLAQRRDIDSVILIGPDHFRAGRRSVTVSSLPWQISGIQLSSDTRILQKLQQTNAVGLEDLPFRLEHSIGLHIDFIGHYFPRTTVTAILVNNGASFFDLAKIVPILVQATGERTLLILSMDLSHGKMPEEAYREDDKSLERILAFRTGELDALDIDARRAAWLFLETLKLKGIHQGVVLERTNSGEIAGRMDESCTSYATIVFY